MEETTQEIDTTNWQLVGLMGDRITCVRLRFALSKSEALNLAAWLVAMADDDDAFGALLKAIQNS